MISRSGWLATASLTASLAAPKPVCAQAPTVRDSAGVQIVVNARPTLPAARGWRVEARPMLEIGASHASTAGDSLYEFSRIMGVVRLADGRYAVGVQAAHTIRFFDTNGRFVNSAGRNGDGPGEFRQILGLKTTAGDTLFVTDLSEVELFTGRGQFIRQGASRRSQPGNFIWPNAVLVDGSYVGIDMNDRAIPPAGRSVRSVRMIRVSDDGRKADTIGTVQVADGTFDGRSTFPVEPVFSPRRQVTSNGRQIFTTWPTRYEIAELTPSGSLIRLIRAELPRVPVSGTAREAYRQWYLSVPGGDGRPMPPSMQAVRQQRLEASGFADHFPAIGAMMSDRPGHLWVRRYDHRELFVTPGPVSTNTLPVPTTWDVFDPRGQWLCTVQLPARFTPLDIGTDYVAGVARDSDDVESVRVYRLVKP